MNINALLSELIERNIKLWADGDRLHVQAPKDSLTPELQIMLAQYKAEIIALLQNNNDRSSELTQIASDPERAYLPFPLTDTQQAYLVGRGDIFELGNIAGHAYWEFDSSDLDIERLDRAWWLLIERHKMLRAIVLPDGQQQILESVPPFHIKTQDLRQAAPEVVNVELEAIRQSMSHQVFVTDQWPLFDIRATLLSDHRVRVYVSFDILIVDAASIFKLFKEWHQLYQDPIVTLAPLEVTFRDYVLAEQAFQSSEKYQHSKQYWLRRLDTLPPAPQIPMIQTLPAGTKPQFVRRSGRLEQSRWQHLKTYAARAGLTPSNILCSAYTDVLAKWSKQEHFTINVTLFNRPPFHPQINDIIGDFTSTILLERHSSSGTFKDRAKRLQEQLGMDLEHAQVSGVQVLRELNRIQGGVTASMPVVFTSTLVYDGATETATALQWLGNIIYSISQTPQVWLDHIVWEQAGNLVFYWDAIEEVFPEHLLDDMFLAFCQLIQRLADEATSWEETISQSVIIPQPQLNQRIAINSTQAPISKELLHTPFIAQIAKQPQQIAVITPNHRLSYEELGRRSYQVGHWLKQCGARPNTLVAIVMEKGWEQVVAVLGVHAAGAAYLPIDPGLPRERVLYLLEHGEVSFVLTQSWLNSSWEWPIHLQRMCIDNEELAQYDDQPLDIVQQPEDLAYVIYTSGSTGMPKGVMIDHRGAVNTVLDLTQRFNLGPNDRVLALSSLSFDLSVYDIFGLLGAGGTIVIPDASSMRDPAHWLELMHSEKVTIWNAVPALMEMLIEYTAHRTTFPSSLRLVMLSGDWIPVGLPDRIRGLVDNVEIRGFGGTTEASIWSTVYTINAIDPNWNSIPYGYPMTNQQCHVLDETLDPCPDWVPGHLYIGGIGLAKGYWRDEAKTNASFLTYPQTGERLYKTGDLARFLPNGDIEFLGREDFQVKIQGQRIELGEIEAALAQHEAVRAVAAKAVNGLGGSKRLVAYVVLNEKQAASHHQLRNSAADQPYDAYEPNQLESILYDPRERLEFRLKQPGLRKGDRFGIQLKKPTIDNVFIDAYERRQTHRTFLNQIIPFEDFSGFLSCLLQIRIENVPLPKYRYASAGNLYPVQTYIYVEPDRIDGVAAGVYYYHPINHYLQLISADVHINRSVHASNNRTIYDQSAFTIFLVGHLNAITPMYGKLARDFCLLEAGYMSQLLMMAASANNIGLCPIGGVNFEAICAAFTLEHDDVFLHGFLGGYIDINSSLSNTDSSSSGTNSIQNKLRDFLRTKLPDHMVPSTVILLDALPLTSNGKVDRKALPEPEVQQTKAEGYVTAQNDTQRALVGIVQQILGVEQISIHENFFTLGATSLHIVQMYNQVRTVLDQAISVTDMFKYPTVSALSDRLQQNPSKQSALQKSYERAEARRSVKQRRTERRNLGGEHE